MSNMVAHQSEGLSRMYQKFTPFWHPSAEVVERAHVTGLANGLGLAGFDQLCAFAAEHPDRYWRHLMDALPIAWSKPYRDYVDLTDGAPFPLRDSHI